MNFIPKKTLKNPPQRNITLNNYKCSQAIEKHILGALIRCRNNLYNNPNLKPSKNDTASKERGLNFKASYIVNEIMSGPNCPNELQGLNCTVFFLTKGGGYQFWGNYKHYVSVSFGDDTILILLN